MSGWTDQEIEQLHTFAMKRRRNGERTGQSYYNAAYNMNPAVARLAGTDCDPFYDDTRLGPFLDKLRALGGAKEKR